MDSKIKNLLTLAAKSGNLVSGEESCLNYLKKASIYLLILAEDSSINTRKKFNDKGTNHNIPIRFWNKKNILGPIIGKGSRSVVGVLDKGFAQSLIKYFDQLP